MNIRQVLFLISIGVLCASCQFFNTERISSETFYKEELESIDWNDVDTYPSFKECETNMEKAGQKSCFQEVIVNTIQSKLSQEKIMATFDVKDTAIIRLQIDTLGKIRVQEMVMDSLVLQKIPNLKEILKESIEQLPLTAPAYKRGIPVTTQMTLPFLINSEEL